MAPRDERGMHAAIHYSYLHKGPLAIRYPRGAFLESDAFESLPFEYGKAQLLQEGTSSILLLGYGSGVGKAIATSKLLAEQGIEAAIVDLRFVKPLDETLLIALSQEYNKWYVFSDSAKIGGVGSLLMAVKEKHTLNVNIKTFEYEDAFITHGATHLVEEQLGITVEQLAEVISKEFY
jgi:1-deoxy-D-xylulose-5-phosphate synthase